MDIEEYKKLARNKLEADDLTKQVRDLIKLTKWQKQDAREGFKETFKPLIKSQDSIKKSIDEQQNATIAQLKANQLALTQGLNKNRLAITEGFDKLDEVKKWNLAQLPGFEAIEEDKEPITKIELDDKGNIIKTPIKKTKKSSPLYNIEKNLDSTDLEILNDMGYPRPNDFFDTDTGRLREIYDEVKNEIKIDSYKISGIKRNKKMTEEEKEDNIRPFQWHKETLNRYKNILDVYLKTLELQVKKGEGIFYFNNPHQLLDRLELLGGSILAGNNGVINEFSQIAHLLYQMKVISKKQLNDLLKII